MDDRNMIIFLILIGLLGLSATVKAASGNEREGEVLSARITKERKKEIEDVRISPVFHPNVQRWNDLIVEKSYEYGIDPNLVAIIVQIESCGNPDAISSAGAMGLGQVMPFHFAAGENPFDPETNLNRGIGYFVQGLQSSGYDIGLSFAGYNGGHRTAQKGKWAWARETKRYHKWATGIFWDIKNGLEESPTINEWYRAGGASLCK